MRIAITGATGMVGRALARASLAQGDTVVALSRDVARAASMLPSARAVAWEADAPFPPAALDGADAIVHLAGEPIADRPWSAEQKRRIRESRVAGTRHVVDGMRAATSRPSVLVCASAIGYYGDRGDAVVDESAPPGNDFLAETCIAWEAEARRAEELGVRVVLLRSGIILSADGGALPRLAMPFRFFVGGPLGDGRQWMSWVHIADEVGLIRHALRTAAVRGPLNAVAPEPVRNAVMAAAIGRVLGRPSLLPAPRVALKLVLGERVDVLLASQRVRPSVALATGYAYQFPALDAALRDTLRGG